jgi:Uma2 family endonuclease
VRLAEDALRLVFPQGFDVRTQLPLALGEYSEPEPDVAVVVGSARDYANAHPTTAVLVVEIADSTLALDRHTKASLYAAAGVPEYWIVNLVERQIEIYREPTPMDGTPFGYGYRTRVMALPGEEIAVPIASAARLRVDGFLP